MSGKSFTLLNPRHKFIGFLLIRLLWLGDDFLPIHTQSPNIKKSGWKHLSDGSRKYVWDYFFFLPARPKYLNESTSNTVPTAPVTPPATNKTWPSWSFERPSKSPPVMVTV
jgi:hypothetical protein